MHLHQKHWPAFGVDGVTGWITPPQELLLSRSSLPSWQKVPGLPFLVDRFGKGTEKATCKSWFLTHFHSDHYKGLTSKFKAGCPHSAVKGVRERKQAPCAEHVGVAARVRGSADDG
ncbi:hypothetical protein WJX75_000111 [Coccomyxa subellipsoidea]|uniref:Metallo-beta-lactamase domain-containing protein n=1 Tax=Coccomyxa subellipsoidea TaxID=248742 RepID=A0ABR2YST4_9CHLO